jgi:ankyrin repeat protein
MRMNDKELIEKTPLLNAIKQNDIIQVNELFDKGIDLNEIIEDEVPLIVTALFKTVEIKNTTIFKILIDKIVDRKQLVIVDDIEVPLLFLVLALSIYLEDIDIIKDLINRDIDLNFLVKKEKNRNILFELSDTKYELDFIKNVIQLLIDNGIDVNAQDDDGSTPLSEAIRNKNSEIVKLLIENGVDFEIKDKDGFTPLFYAIKYGDIEIVRLLIGNGIDINSQVSNDISPLHIAILLRNIEMIKLLINNGADVNIKGIKEETPLCIAYINGDEDIEKLLIENGSIKDGKCFSQKIRPLFSDIELEIVKNSFSNDIEDFIEKFIYITTQDKKNGTMALRDVRNDIEGFFFCKLFFELREFGDN